MKARNSNTSSSSSSRRVSSPTVLLFGVLVLFLLIRTVFLALDSPVLCSSLECIGFGWKFGLFGGSEKLAKELTRELTEAQNVNFDERGSDGPSLTFNNLVADVIASRLDIKAFASKTKAMVTEMEKKVGSARQQESVYRHLASYGIPRSMHCLSLTLAEEYSVNALARSPLPSPELVYRISNPSYHHFVLFTDNILAASVVVSSTLTNSAHPENLVFHIVTEKKSYAPMYAWFALNPATPAVVEVKGLHQFDWPLDMNLRVKEILEIQQSARDHFDYLRDKGHIIEYSWPSYLSIMDQLWIYLPELFPELNRIILLDDDTLIQHDLSPLWELNLNGFVNGAVVSYLHAEKMEEDTKFCPGKKYGNYLNFSQQDVFSKFESDHCAWLSGMNVFDLQAWRRTNITENYHHWLKLNLKSGFGLCLPGAYPPALIAFEGHVHPIDYSWHIAGLGHHPLRVRRENLDTFAVLHFSGPAKPWLDIAFPELRNLWNTHVNYSNEFIRNCLFWS